MNSAHRRILLADDDAGMRRFLKQVLLSQGDEVVVVENGREALDSWMVGQFSLLVTDYQMPDRTGTQIIQEIRSQGDITPVLLMSGTLDDEAIRICKEAGRVVCLSKPFGISEFRAAIDWAITSPVPARVGEVDKSHPSSGVSDHRLGRLAIREGLISDSQLRKALEVQESESIQGMVRRRIGLVLVNLGLLNERSLESLLREQRELRGR